MPLTLLLGGARSGKSALALRLASAWPGSVTFVATATELDGEMADRIARHRRERPPDWTTIEAPLGLEEACEGVPSEAFLVVDCLTLWVANLLEAGRTEEEAQGSAAAVAAAVTARAAPAVVVSNEVGLGLVPGTPLGRSFRDLLGRVNGIFAEACDHAYLLVAGRALELGDPPA